MDRVQMYLNRCTGYKMNELSGQERADDQDREQHKPTDRFCLQDRTGSLLIGCVIAGDNQSVPVCVRLLLEQRYGFLHAGRIFQEQHDAGAVGILLFRPVLKPDQEQDGVNKLLVGFV